VRAHGYIERPDVKGAVDCLAAYLAGLSGFAGAVALGAVGSGFQRVAAEYAIEHAARKSALMLRGFL
jgi:hypothetical protein